MPVSRHRFVSLRSGNTYLRSRCNFDAQIFAASAATAANLLCLALFSNSFLPPSLSPCTYFIHPRIILVDPIYRSTKPIASLLHFVLYIPWKKKDLHLPTQVKFSLSGGVIVVGIYSEQFGC